MLYYSGYLEKHIFLSLVLRDEGIKCKRLNYRFSNVSDAVIAGCQDKRITLGFVPSVNQCAGIHQERQGEINLKESQASIRLMNNDGGLLYGNGCHRHPDCFTCPFPPDDCHYDYTEFVNLRGRERESIEAEKEMLGA